MKKLIEELALRCKDAIEQAASESYSNGDNPNSFDGCSCSLDLKDSDVIEIYCDEKGNHEVHIIKENCNLVENIENAITEYLDCSADEFSAWQVEFDNDMWRDVDPGCDPAFPHRGDFERWAYGR